MSKPLNNPDFVILRHGQGDGATVRYILKEDAYDALIDGIDQLKVENSKLRELLASTISNYVDGYMDGTSARYPCDLCDESSMQQCDYQHDGQCPFYSQLRELGIEVDDGNET